MKVLSHTIYKICLCLIVSLLLISGTIGHTSAQTAPSDRDLFDFPESVDLYFAYSSDQAVSLVPVEGLPVIVFNRTPFEQVHEGLIDHADWQTVESVELWPGDTIVLDRFGELYKLAVTLSPSGDIPEIQVTYAPVPATLPDSTPPSSVVLSYYEGVDVDTDSNTTFTDPTVASVIFCDLGPSPPTPTPDPSVIPEPGTGMLLIIGLLGALGSWIGIRRKRKSSSGKWWLFLLVLSMAVLLVGGIELVVAQQSCTLTIEKQGDGSGRVIGRGVDCGTACTVNPFGGGSEVGPGEVLNLKAIPDEGSEFSHWLIDGETYQGIFRMTGDTTMTAVFGAVAPPTLTPTPEPGSCTPTNGGIEQCDDEIDNDCDGKIDEGCGCDTDFENHQCCRGDSCIPMTGCAPGEAAIFLGCSNVACNPMVRCEVPEGGPCECEIADDGIDNDCDGYVDEPVNGDCEN